MAIKQAKQRAKRTKAKDIKTLPTKALKPGRKKLDIPNNDVQKLAEIGCTNTEIADFYGCDISTITKRFSQILTKGRESGKMRLRKKQMQVALKGNVIMLIWLGKQMLNQKEKQDISFEGLSLTDIVALVSGKNGKD